MKKPLIRPGNAAYGKTATDKLRHLDVKYPSEEETPRLIADPRFKALNEVDVEAKIYEVTMRKKRIDLDLPLQIAFFVYCYAKLRMLQFYYDFIDVYLDRQDYEYCEMDTDSAYIALSAPSFEALIKPTMVDRFYADRAHWLPSEYCNRHAYEFKEVERRGEVWTRFDSEASDFCKDCLSRKQYTRRTPGLFKLEWAGAGIVSLCSKTYYAFGKLEKDKVSAKGLIKRQNDLNPTIYKNVLLNRKAASGTNMSFRVINNAMYTYMQGRDALSYFYVKRKIGEDNVSTLPLDI